MSIGCSVQPSQARSASTSPMTEANLNPCPEHGLATITCGCRGWRSRMKCPSGVFVYMQVVADSSSPLTVGRWRSRIAAGLADLVGVDLAADVGRRARHAGVVARHLDAVVAEGREPVEELPGFVLDEEDRELPGREQSHVGRRSKPVQDVALDRERQAEVREQLPHPWPGAQDEGAGDVGPLRGGHLDGIAGGGPAHDWLLPAKGGAGLRRCRGVGPDAVLGEEHARDLVQHADRAVVDRECREAAPDLGCVEDLVRQAVHASAGEGSSDDAAVWRTEHQSAGGLDQSLAGVTLELRPQLVRAAEERDVCRVLEVRLARHPGSPV